MTLGAQYRGRPNYALVCSCVGRHRLLETTYFERGRRRAQPYPAMRQDQSDGCPEQTQRHYVPTPRAQPDGCPQQTQRHMALISASATISGQSGGCPEQADGHVPPVDRA